MGPSGVVVCPYLSLMVSPSHEAKNYAAIQSMSELRDLVDRLMESDDPIGFDVETGYHGPDRPKGALNPFWEDQFIVGFSFTNSPDWARYVPLNHDLAVGLPEYEVWEIMKPLLEQKQLVIHHHKFEAKNLLMLEQKGRGPKIEIKTNFYDSMLEAYVLSLFRRVGLKELVKDIFDHDMMHIQALFPGMTAAQEKCLRFNVLDLTPEVIAYACEDAAWCLALHQKLGGLAQREVPGVFRMEHEISDLMTEVETFGMHFEWDAVRSEYERAKGFSDRMEAAVKQSLSELAERDLTSLNLGSPKQMRELLYRDLGMSTSRQTAGAADPTKAAGKAPWELMSTDQVALEGLSRKHAPIKKMLEWREVQNHLNRFAKYLNENSNCFDSRIHANFSQVTVSSGRFSANDPAVQQMPKDWRFSTRLGLDVKDDEAWEASLEGGQRYKDYWFGNFRDFVTAPPGHYLLGFDFSQVELRILAGASQEPALLKAFETGEDVHVATAALMLGKAKEDVTKDDRAQGKTCNFAVVYGAGPGRIADMLAISVDQAKDLLRDYFDAYSSVRAFFEEVKAKGQQDGFARTWYGRRAKVWELESPKSGVRAKGDRMLGNIPIQGGAADYMKIAMIRARKVLIAQGWWGSKVKMIHNIHDALVFEASDDIDPNELRAVLEKAVTFPVPGMPMIAADWELGQSHGSPQAWKEGMLARWDGQHWRLVRDSDEVEDVPLPEPEEVPFFEPDPEPEVLEESEPVDLVLTPPPPPAPPVEIPAVSEAKELEFVFSVLPTSEQASALLNLLQKNPGPNNVTFVLPDERVPVRETTRLDTSDAGAISIAVPGLVVREAKGSMNLDSLVEGLQL